MLRLAVLASSPQSSKVGPGREFRMAASGGLPGHAYMTGGTWAQPAALPSSAPGRPLSATCNAERIPDVFEDNIYTIIFLALAVFIFLRLRSVLGRRTGRERPPYDPYSARDAVRSPASEKVVTLPTRPVEAAPRAIEVAPSAERWKGVAESGSAAASGLDAIAAADSGFDVQHFLTGARTAYEMVVTAFAAGDRRQLRGLLSREVFDGFDAAISEREARGETVESKFVSIDSATVSAAELRARSTAQITVRFVSKLVSATRDRSGAVIDGNAEKVTEVTDLWTFARDVASRDPNWKVAATETGQ
jgi:predicted lipid-binding transport protein (Tim44 family)